MDRVNDYWSWEAPETLKSRLERNEVPDSVAQDLAAKAMALDALSIAECGWGNDWHIEIYPGRSCELVVSDKRASINLMREW